MALTVGRTATGSQVNNGTADATGRTVALRAARSQWHITQWSDPIGTAVSAPMARPTPGRPTPAQSASACAAVCNPGNIGIARTARKAARLIQAVTRRARGANEPMSALYGDHRRASIAPARAIPL